MPSDDIIDDDAYNYLETIKELPLTRNEALYLSDSITLLLEITPEQGKVQVPARHLLPQGSVTVSIELVQAIGLAVLLTTQDEWAVEEATIKTTVADLFILRECCQSYIKVNQEYVGFNLLRKIYALILEKDLQERNFIEDLTRDVDTSLIPHTDTLQEIQDRRNKYLKNRKDND
jgi:hypothetical protein